MRLIDTKTFKLRTSNEQEVKNDFRYAILSHRWTPGVIEVPFHGYDAEKVRNSHKKSPALAKIFNACVEAARQGLPWLWIDTCCINKQNSTEESESINSMFRWYREAKVCLVYLFDVSNTGGEKSDPFTKANGEPSEWFERGWTLQELLAPQNMRFYNQNWKYLGTKTELSQQLASITRIHESYLTGAQNFKTASIAQKMSWMAGRRTERKEDLAYSLIGIFDVFMTPQYGEGARAFTRLEQILMSEVADESIFAWTTPKGGLPIHSLPGDWAPDEWGLLAPSPECFLNSGDIHNRGRIKPRVADSYSATQEGVMFTVPGDCFAKRSLLIPLSFLPPFGVIYDIYGRKRRTVSFALNCWRNDEKGRPKPVRIFIRREGGNWRRCKCDELPLARSVESSSSSSHLKKCIVMQPRIKA